METVGRQDGRGQRARSDEEEEEKRRARAEVLAQ